MYFKLKDGTPIKVGKQDFGNETVPVEVEGKHVDCSMFQHDGGDIGFIVNNEEVLFHWLKYKPY